jgi:hypothetical protein
MFVVPFVKADIVFNNDFYDKYNLVDSIDVQGYVVANSNVNNIFRLYLDCGDSSQLLAGRNIHVNKNENYYFNQEVNLPISSKGKCNFRADFNDESRDSSDFEITNSLKGDVFVTNTKIKLGQELILEGDVYRLSNEGVNGFGMLTLSKEDEEFFADSFDVINGNIEYSSVLDSLPAGEYTLDVEIYDYYGNHHIFSFGQKIQVLDELTARLSLDSYEVLQGSSLKVVGEVDDSESYEVYIEYEDKSETLNFYSKTFQYEIKLGVLEGGNHRVLIKILDNYGNFYSETLNYDIVSVPNSMDVSADSNVLPGEDLNVEATIYDKANYVYDGSIKFTFLNPEGQVLSTVNIDSGDIYTLSIEDYTKPGVYKVVFEGSEFNEERSFTVNKLEKIDAYYEDNRLKIKNIGNVDLSDKFTVSIEGEDIDFEYNLKPSEIENFDLRGWVKEGVYDLIVNSQYGEISVTGVDVIDDRSGFQKVTGFVVGANGGSGTLLWVIFIVVIVGVVYFVFFFKRKKPQKGKEVYEGDYNRDYEEGKGAKQRLMDKRNKMKSQPRKMFPSKDIPKKDADEFRDSMVKKMGER